MDEDFLKLLTATASDIALRAGRIALAYYNAASRVEVLLKSDRSPVTEADIAVDREIGKGLSILTPDFPVISEETYTPDQPGGYDTPYWLVDPIDGTKEFIARTGDFTVNIALMVNRRPMMGVIYVPVTDELFRGGPGGVWLLDRAGERRINVRGCPVEGPTVITSRYLGKRAKLDEFLAAHQAAASLQRGSSLKFCEIAAGRADLYPQFGTISEWDIAAGHAIVEAAGGRVTDFSGAGLIYGNADKRQPPFVATSNRRGIGAAYDSLKR